ncbi:NUT member 2F [Saguinus oedipus]|uniref:NUT member 2F n=1 Tax=Saguinus oedipus TaxID=9490 RepID=A0ABQ9UCE1_SAGOE|nr:NUT member 2F [Saguinus oedipus]
MRCTLRDTCKLQFPSHTPSAVGHPSDSPVTRADLETPAHSPLSFVSTACPVLEPGVTENPGASVPVFTALSFATPAPGPAHGPPLVTAVVPPGGPPVLSAFPGTPLVAGQDGRGPKWTGASEVFGQMMTEMGPVKAPQEQTSVLTQAPLIWQASGAVCENVACPPPQPLAAAPVVPAMAAHILGGTQACEGGWFQRLPAPAPPQPPQLAPIMAAMNACPRPQGALMGREASLPPRPRPKRMIPATPRACMRTSDSGSTTSPWPGGTFPRVRTRKRFPVSSCECPRGTGAHPAAHP